MRTFRRISLALLITAAISSPALLTGCTGHVSYYDAEYRDYHPWNHDEIVFYGQWENETHRNHEEFKDRPANEQSEYWHWRHNHDHDNDHH